MNNIRKDICMDAAEKLNKVSIVKVHKKNTLSDALTEKRDMLRDLLEKVVKQMVPYPEDIAVRYSCGEKTTIYKIDCSQRVLGHIIGSRGKNIQSVRTIVQGISAGKGFRSIVEIPYYEQET